MFNGTQVFFLQTGKTDQTSMLVLSCTGALGPHG